LQNRGRTMSNKGKGKGKNGGEGTGKVAGKISVHRERWTVRRGRTRGGRRVTTRVYRGEGYRARERGERKSCVPQQWDRGIGGGRKVNALRDSIDLGGDEMRGEVQGER